ncbi:MAG: hypothetical protein WC624_03750, partial [Candidatus Margulisiibacteriota bacterium]
MNNKGVTLLATVFIIVMFAILGMVAVSLMSGENLLAYRDYNSIRAFHLAGAGLNYTISYSLADDDDWSNNSGFSKNLSPGSFSVEYIYRSKKNCTVKITGVVGDVSRSITVSIKKSGLPDAFSYGIYASNPGGRTLYIQNNSTAYGDFYYNGPVVMQNSAKLINGTMYSTSLTLQNSATCASWEPVSPVDPPSFDPSYYDSLLSETTKTAYAAGPLNMSGGTLYLENNETKYYTYINLTNSAKVVGPGTIVATTGNFSLSNSAQISDEVTVIVKGTSTIANSATVKGDFHLISNGSVSFVNNGDIPAEALLFSYGNVSFANSSKYWGSILAPSGEVLSTNSTTFNGLIYADRISLTNSSVLNGSAAVEQVGYFSNSVKLTYDPSKFPSFLPQGLG